MARLKAMAGHVLLTSLGVVVGAVILIVLKGGVSYLPRLDGTMFPVVRSTAAPTVISRDKDRACFALHLQKIAPGEPIKSQFFVEASLRNTWLAPSNIDAMPMNPEWKNRAVGEPWIQRWCFDPGAIADSQAMRISGYAVHSRRPFFATETPLPTFVIPAL